MKVGDAVRFIGFEDHRDPNHDYSLVGIIVQWVICDVHADKRFNVAWPDGTFGRWLYPETLEVVSESR
tara:strand:+ start:2068 stop:2271 length:204 start_codon:yes stop_codon:yes gene_type:complete